MPKLNYFLIASFFCLPFLPWFIPQTAILYYTLTQEALPLFLSLIFIFINLILKPKLNLKLNYLIVFLLGFSLLLVFNLYIFNSVYNSAIYYSLLVLFSLIIVCSLINSLDYNLQKLLIFIASSILITSYLQIIIAIFQLNNYYFPISLTSYPSNQLIAQKITYYLLPQIANNRVSGGIAQANLLAEFLTWGILANSYLWHIKKIKNPLIFMLSLSLLSIFIGLSQSRVALGYALFLLFYGGFIAYKWRKPNLLISAFVLALVLGFFVFHPNNPDLPNRYLESFNTPTGAAAASDNQRLILWYRGLLMFKDHPLFGVGFNNFASYIFKYPSFGGASQSLPQLALPSHAHNLIIELLATTGLVGFSLVSIIVIYIYKQLFKLDLAKQLLPIGILSLSLIHSQTEYPLFYTQFLFCVALLVNVLLKKNSFNFYLTWKFNVLNFLFSLFLAFLLYTGVNNYLILTLFKKPAPYSNTNFMANIITKYQIGANPLWTYPVDLDLVSKTNFYTKNYINENLFDLLYRVNQKLYNYSPFANVALNLSVLNQVQGKTAAAHFYLRTLNTNYSSFTPQFSKGLLRLVNNESNLAIPLINYLKQIQHKN